MVPDQNVSNGTIPCQGEQQLLCHFILESMHTCTSYGPKNPDGRTMHARTSHAQATHNASTYTELKFYQLCLSPCKLARQKYNGIKTTKEDIKENPPLTIQSY